MHDDEYTGRDGLALATLVAKGEVTAAEVLDAARRRARAVNPRINAIVRWLDAEADERVGTELTGPFAGVPFLLKELHHEWAGVPTSSGTRALADHVAPETATVVQRWLDAGVVVFGQTNTPELGAKSVTEPELFGPARNPWDPRRTPGGSSGGAAAAVAAGIVPVAGANDGGGSIRIPAACCGLFGLKPGRGLVPSGPVMGEGLHGAVTHGVISRSVRDSAAMLDVLAGPDATAPPFLPAVPAGSYLDDLDRPPQPLRIGYTVASSLRPDPHPEAVAAVTGAAALLEELGHEVEPAEIGIDDAGLALDFLVPWFVQVAEAVAEVRARSGGAGGAGGFELDTEVMAAVGRATPAPTYLAAVTRWHDHVRALSAFHRRYDLLLTPTIAEPPPFIGAFAISPVERILARAALAVRGDQLIRRVGIVEQVARRELGWVPHTQLANVTGRPAATVPLHWTAEGLPLGVQFVGDLGSEGLLLRLAAQLEGARPWHDRRPAVPRP